MISIHASWAFVIGCWREEENVVDEMVNEGTYYIPICPATIRICILYVWGGDKSEPNKK